VSGLKGFLGSAVDVVVRPPGAARGRPRLGRGLPASALREHPPCLSARIAGKNKAACFSVWMYGCVPGARGRVSAMSRFGHRQRRLMPRPSVNNLQRTMLRRGRAGAVEFAAEQRPPCALHEMRKAWSPMQEPERFRVPLRGRWDHGITGRARRGGRRPTDEASHITRNTSAAHASGIHDLCPDAW